MGVASFGGFGAAHVAAASMAMRPRYGGGGGYPKDEEPEPKKESKFSFEIKFLAVGIILLVLGIVMSVFDDTYQKHTYKCTVIGKGVTSHKYKSRDIIDNKMAFRSDEGYEWDGDVSFLTYSKFNVGDRIDIQKTNAELGIQKTSWLYNLLAGLFIVLGGCMLFSFAFVALFAWGLTI